MQKSIFSIDVEDWFHVLDTSITPSPSRWNDLPSRVEKNLFRLFDLLDASGRHATCFFLGWVGKQYPHLVKEAVRRGHEVASHGNFHLMADHSTQREYRDEIAQSKDILEQISGSEVLGFRAAGFSVNQETPWFFDLLAEAGYRYDSSVFPGHAGQKDLRNAPYLVERQSGTIVEFPISVLTMFGQSLCFSGGGYLRLMPYRFIASCSRATMNKARPVVFYVHPREIDPQHPRLQMNPFRRFKSYVNLKGTEEKLRRLLAEFETVSFAEYMTETSSLMPAHFQ